MKNKLIQVNIAISPKARQRLKVIAAKRGVTIKSLIEEFAKTLKA